MAATNETIFESRISGGPRLLFVAGGTGGHLYPAIAVAEKCRELAPDAEIRFVGARGRLEEEVVPRAGFELDLLWISGLNRGASIKNVLLPFKLLRSLAQAYRIVNAFRPDVIVCAGAFVSYPMGMVAVMRKVPLVLMESNALPGRTVRRLAPRAVEVHVAFEEARRYLPGASVVVSGNPIRKEFGAAIDRGKAASVFGLKPERPTLLAFGGSQGARSINTVLEGIAEALFADGVQLIWQTGRRFRGPERREPHLYRARFIHEMPQAFAAADLVLSRAGATTIAELRAVGKPSILVPMPTAADDHQRINAEAMRDEGAAVMIPDADLVERLYGTVVELLAKPDLLHRMAGKARERAVPDADDKIARRVLAVAGQRR